jgi:ATP-dependent RNA helicase RhlE
MKQDAKKPTKGFRELGLSSDFLKIIKERGFTAPSPIQEQAIPVALKGKDVIGIAQTGTGKTLAFCLPMLQKLRMEDKAGLVVVPTRELALQVKEEIDRSAQNLGFTTVLIIGGAHMQRQIHRLKREPDVIICTPGRMNDHIERRTAKLDRIGYLVLDEADRMLDMGFTKQIDAILKALPPKRQTMLFSATMPPAIKKLAQGYMQKPVTIEVTPEGTSAKNVQQGMYYLKSERRYDLLQHLLKKHKGKPVLVFCRTKYGTKKMAKNLSRDGFPAEELHSNRTLHQRLKAMENFKNGKSQVMVATDVAARGIDVKEIALVVNYDLPEQLEDYVHRIGRTGRAGHKGHAVSFALPNQRRTVKEIEKIVGVRIPVIESKESVSKQELEDTPQESEKKGKNRKQRGRKPGNRYRKDAKKRNSTGKKKHQSPRDKKKRDRSNQKRKQR